MKKIIFLSLLVTCFTMITFSQSIGIGTTTPNASSILEIKASNKGLLIPRTSTASRTAIVTPAKGLMVYDTTTNSFWYHNGTTWTQIGTSGSGWSLTGNSGTDSNVNFIGTTDISPLLFRVNNLKAGIIDSLSRNTALGFKALDSNKTGGANSAFGYEALYRNNIGSTNTAMGHRTLFSNSGGTSNTATGEEALFANTTGNNNTASGTGALFSNTTGNNNTSMGYQSLNSNTTGYSNVAIGTGTLHVSANASNLVAVGDSALYNNGTGAINNYDGAYNTAVGSKALYSNTTGFMNTANGYLALSNNITGYWNTANGVSALRNDSTGYSNTASGFFALSSNITGYNNTANGVQALYSNTGYSNTANGAYALNNNTIGNNNTAVGYNALQSNFTGSFNTALGVNADVIGDNTNSTAIGYGGYVNTSNVVEIGNSSVTNIGGTVGWTVYSDGRFKKSIQPNVPGLSFITQLKPVTYTFDVRGFNKFSGADERLKQKDTGQAKNNAAAINAINEKAINDKEKIVYTGLVAQDVEQAANKIGYNFSGVHKPQNDKDHYGLDYGSFVVPLIRAVQEQQAIIEDQNKKIDLQQQQINALLSDVERLKQKINTPVK